MNADGTGFNTCKECHKTESLWNHTTTDHKEREQLEDRRNVGESSCNFGDGTDQRVQSLMFMMMMMMIFPVLLGQMAVYQFRPQRWHFTFLLSSLFSSYISDRHTGFDRANNKITDPKKKCPVFRELPNSSHLMEAICSLQCTQQPSTSL